MDSLPSSSCLRCVQRRKIYLSSLNCIYLIDFDKNNNNKEYRKLIYKSSYINNIIFFEISPNGNWFIIGISPQK